MPFSSVIPGRGPPVKALHPKGRAQRQSKGLDMLSWVQPLLDSDVFSILARIILTSFFWIAGLVGLFRPALIVASVERAGLPMAKFIAAIMVITELGGSILLITNWQSLGWLGAGWLGVFTALSIPLGHPFWKFDAPKRMEEFQLALEHLALIGGLMCAAALLS